MEQQSETQATTQEEQDESIVQAIMGNAGEIGFKYFTTFMRPVFAAAGEKMNGNQLMALHMGMFSGLLASLLTHYGWEQTHQALGQALGDLDKDEFDAIIAQADAEADAAEADAKSRQH